MLRVLVIAVPLLALAGTARADDGVDSPDESPAAGERLPRYYIAGGVAGVSTDSATMLGSYRLSAGKPVIGPLWVTAHLARSVAIEPDAMDPGAAHATEVGGGMELRRCRFPWFVCGAVGVNAAVVIDDHGDVTPALLPHIDGEIGVGNLALRLGLEGRYGKASGVGASTAIVLRF